MPITNPFFQDSNWQTVPAGDPRGAGNQIPPGWTLTVAPANQPLTIPTKKSDCGTKTTQALSSGPPEAVHKLADQLPDNEKLGATRALVLTGDKVYKIFAGGGGNTFSATLSQELTYAPGAKIKIGAWVLAETNDAINPACGKLEDDHAWAILDFGTAHDKRDYKTLSANRELSSGGNTRAWNLLLCESIIPASGKITVALTLQQNWMGNVDFFIGGVTDTILETPGPGTGNGGTTPPAGTPTTLQDINAGLTMINNAQTYLEAARLALTVAAQRESSG